MQSPIVGKIAAAISDKILNNINIISREVNSIADNPASGSVGITMRRIINNAVSGAVSDAVRSAVSDAVDDAVSYAVSDAVSRAVSYAVHDAVDDAVSNAVRDAVYFIITAQKLKWHYSLGGQFWVGRWYYGTAFASFFIENCNLEVSQDIYERFEAYKKSREFLVGTTNGMNVGVYTLFKGEINNTKIAYIRCYCPSTDRMFFLGVNSNQTNAKDAIASLYRVPRKLVGEIKNINRQGERYSTTFTKKGLSLLKSLKKEEIEDLSSIDGNTYFSKIKYEY